MYNSDTLTDGGLRVCSILLTFKNNVITSTANGVSACAQTTATPLFEGALIIIWPTESIKSRLICYIHRGPRVRSQPGVGEEPNIRAEQRTATGAALVTANFPFDDEPEHGNRLVLLCYKKGVPQ